MLRLADGTSRVIHAGDVIAWRGEVDAARRRCRKHQCRVRPARGAREIRTRWRIATDPRRTADEYAVWLDQLLSLEGCRPRGL